MGVEDATRQDGPLDGALDPSLERALARAAGALREGDDAGWVRVRPRALDRARATFRTGRPVPAAHDLGAWSVGEPALRSALRLALADEPDARLLAADVHLGPDGTLLGLTLAVAAAYGADLEALARRVRVRALDLLLDGIGVVGDDLVVDVLVRDVEPPAAGTAGATARR